MKLDVETDNTIMHQVLPFLRKQYRQCVMTKNKCNIFLMIILMRVSKTLRSAVREPQCFFCKCLISAFISTANARK